MPVETTGRVGQPPLFSQSDAVKVNAEMARLAQRSMREVRHLRIVLTGLMNKSPNVLNEVGGQEAVQVSENRNSDSTILNPTNVSVFGKASDDRSPLEQGGELRVDQKSFVGPKQPSETDVVSHILHTIDDVGSTIRKLDSLSSQMLKLRNSGVLSTHNLLSAVDQLDFTPLCLSNDSEGYSGADNLRRVDWLVGRTEASRWLRRASYRTDLMGSTLASCSLFRRTSGIPAPETINELDNQLFDFKRQCPDFSFILLQPTSRNPILHIKVADSFQCLLSFGNFSPENIIIRGLDETNCVSTFLPSSVGSTSKSGDLSSAMTELLLTYQKNPLDAPYLLADIQKSPSVQFKNVVCSEVDVSVLDLCTPSRYIVFRKITDLARCALQHFSSGLSAPKVRTSLLRWLYSYRNLFTTPCIHCKMLLGENATLPIWHNFSSSEVAQHEHCLPISRKK